MSGKYTWKLILTALVLIWAVVNLIPLQDTPFEDYFQQEATGGAEFDALVAKAKAREASDENAPSFFVAVKRVAEEDGVDISKFFPELPLEESLVNIRKRNSILLDYLLKESRGQVTFALDLKGGVAFVLEVDQKAFDAANATERKNELDRAIEIIGERVDAFGVAEPIIRSVGENRIEVQLSGVSTRDNPEIIDAVKKPARLEFRLVHLTQRPGLTPDEESPVGYEVLDLEHEDGGTVSVESLYVKKVPEMTGEMIAESRVSADQFGKPVIGLQFTSDGADRFEEVTRQIAEGARELDPSGRLLGRLAIVLDGKLYSAPTVQNRIPGGRAQITGNFTPREAYELRDVLNNPLDIPLQVVEMSEIGPSLAADSIESGRKAFLFAIAVTAIVIVVLYTGAGLAAVIAMATNVILILAVMASEMFNAALSMPGIAGIVLTIGMSVDANILIFERIREELGTGKNLKAALEAGFEKAFSAILDANVTTLITAIIMMKLGTGPVKGFGLTLAIGLFANLFAALIISRGLLELAVFTNAVKRIKFFSIMPHTEINFMRFFRPAFIGAWCIVAIGVVMLFVKGESIYGIDFRGGDQLALTFTDKVDVADIRSAAGQVGVDDVVPVYQTDIGSGREVLKIQTPFDQGETVLSKLNELFPQSEFEVESESRIGPSVSSGIRINAFLAIGLSLVGILVYVAFRFEIGYGVGAVVATVHDLLMTIGVFVLFDRQFNAAMVGAILLIVGYSINDTIVVFDRIREELQLNPNMRLRDVINQSINRTLSRTLITSGTTLFTALSLFFLAGGAVNDIAFTLIIGILTGTFSSIFIASPVFFWWHKGDRKHVEASHDIVPKYEWSASSRAAE